jgi:hypothetical protein|tara:strand:+ start:227 stop:787 length:561 start_codon:yes stop_codon:yes gene_type:complete
MSNAYKRQIQNRNFLSPVGFKFTLARAPKLAFFTNSVNLPGVSLGVAEQSSYLRMIPVPGDMMDFNDFELRFLVDEDLQNYLEIQNWIRGIGFPDSLNEIYEFQQENNLTGKPFTENTMNLYSDGTLQILTSSDNIQYNVKFRDMFPISLSDINFDATDTDIQYFTANVTFKYSIYDITDEYNKPV